MGSISVKKKTKNKTRTKKSLQDGPNLRRNIYVSGANSQKLGKTCKIRGGTLIFFWWSVWPEVWNPNPYLRIFHTQNTKQNETKQKQKTKQTKKEIDSFLEIFANWDPFVMFFLPQKRLTLQFFAIFCHWTLL